MVENKFLDEISSKIQSMLIASPAADIERNLKSLLQSTFAKLDLVTREEFDVQTQVLQNARAQLNALEQKITELENRLK